MSGDINNGKTMKTKLLKKLRKKFFKRITIEVAEHKKSKTRLTYWW